MRKFLLYIALTLPISISAQTNLSNAEMRIFNSRIIELLENYEYTIQDDTERGKYEFTSLFENKNILIYNDLLGLSTEKELTIENYINTLHGKSKACNVIIKDVKRGEMYEDDHHYLIKVSFNKYIQYHDKCGVFFDSKEFYKSDHQINALIAMNKEDKTVYFRNLDGSIDTKTQPLSKNYRVIVRNEERDNKVLVNGKRPQYNIFDQAFVEENAMIEYEDHDVSVKLTQDNPGCNIHSLKYKPHRWRIKPYFEFSVGKILDLGAEQEMLKSAYMMDYGIDIGYAMVSRPKFKLSFVSGFGLSTSKAFLNTSFNYSYYEYSDVDGDSYNRYSDVSNFSATMKIQQYVVPFYLDFDFRLAKKVSLYLQGGAKVYFTSLFNVNDIVADVNVYGIYPQYNNLKMENYEPNDFKRKTITFDKQEIDKKYFSMDFFGSLGFRFNIYKFLYLDTQVSFQTGYTPIYSSSRKIYLNGNISKYNALISYKTSENIGTVTDIFREIKKSCVRLNIGLLFKL